MITRDRAGAYANAISEVLPDVMQIADRFHLYQNLSKAVREAIYSQLPSKIVLSDDLNENPPDVVEDIDKKNTLTVAEQHRKGNIIMIQSYLAQGYSNSQICKMMNTTYRQIRKYSSGDPDILCRRSKTRRKERLNSLAPYCGYIKERLIAGIIRKQIYMEIVAQGHTGKRSDNIVRPYTSIYSFYDYDLAFH